MKLKEIYKCSDNQTSKKKPIISFEVFPPKENFEEKSTKLIEEIEYIRKFAPAFISVTYGAGGSSQENSLELAMKIKQQIGFTPMLHFTCIGFSRQKVLNYLKTIENAGIEHILALRGDIPDGMKNPMFDFKYANELVEFIKTHSNLSIGVAGYPEKHKEAISFDEDINNLKRKVDAGAEVIITQLFYNNDLFFKFLDKTSKAGITIPIIPGVMPILSFKQIDKITKLCGASVDESLKNYLLQHEKDPESMKKAGLDFSQKQCQQLVDAGVKGLHLYSLNKFSHMVELLENVL